MLKNQNCVTCILSFASKYTKARILHRLVNTKGMAAAGVSDKNFQNFQILSQ